MTTPIDQSTSLALLSVEDSPDDLELILLELRRNGLTANARRVQTREEMEHALREQPWDVICVDWQMPHFDTLRALEVRAELAPDAPVIVVSGSIGEAAAVTLMKAGVDDYIPKDSLARLAPALRRAMRDAAERRARRQAEDERARLVVALAAALELRDEFLILASHELRTPLTALRFQVEGAVRALGEHEPVRRKLLKADHQIERIARLVEDMIAVSKLRPPAALEPRATDVRELVDGLVKSFSLAERTENIVAHLPSSPVVIALDRMQMEDALRRILSNAVKYGPGLPIDVRLERLPSTVRISVTDRGIGIAPEKQGRIFERFGRAESSENYGGLGLGLWIARNIVEGHGGTLTVASAPGAGATFTVSIPMQP
jgi:signal transduction histidine kinase